jgi:sarcosine oxidase/L-pipecolate oxidase
LLTALLVRAGKFKKPIVSIDRTTCIGAECEDGTVRLADRVILACGAWTPTLIDLEGQCVSKVRHVV